MVTHPLEAERPGTMTPEGTAVITLEEATQIIDEALRYARSRDLAPMTVAVEDSRGCLIALKAEKGSDLLRPAIADGKACSALGLGVGTRTLAARSAKQPSFYAALAALTDGRVLPVPGGVLIRADKGELIGAAGASGDIADHDEDCVVAGITRAGFTADAGQG
jgi:uncharacterized protein GlcG (DUF336 family)